MGYNTQRHFQMHAKTNFNLFDPSCCLHDGFFANSGNASFTKETQNEYLDELEARASAGALQIDYINLPLTTQFAMQKAMSKAQKGTVVEKGDGQKVDARDVKYGSGGKKGHRAVNNRLKDVDGCRLGSAVGRDNECFDDEMSEAIKRSEEDEFLMNERKKERMEMERMEKELISKEKETGCEGRKKREVINVDEEDSDIDDTLNGSKDVASTLANNMFERVNKRMKKIYSHDIRSLKKIDDEDEKDVKKIELKKMKKSLKRLREDKCKNEHVDLIERLTSDGDDLMSPNKMNSQNVMELILDEHEMEDDDE